MPLNLLCQAAMINENIEENLFSMLDGETDSEYVTIIGVCVCVYVVYPVLFAPMRSYNIFVSK